MKVKEYWRLATGNAVVPDQDAIEYVDQALLDSVCIHVRSDVPVGSFLSGGYDSSAMVYYMNRIGYPTQSFAIGFSGWDDSEHQYAELVAETFGTDHISTVVDTGHLELVEKLVYYYDDPIADISIIPTYVVSRSARRRREGGTFRRGRG